MRKLRIAQVAPLWLTIPPEKYGGIERIDQIDRILVRKSVEERFNKEIMVANYEKVYNKLLEK